MKKDAFLLGLFLSAGIVVGTKLTEKAIGFIPAGIKYIKGLKKPKDADFEPVK